MTCKKRRGIHGLLAVSMLIGFTIAMSTVLLAVLSDYADVATSSAECSLSGVSLYGVGERAYFAATLRNLGSHDVASANVTFVDDLGLEHGFYNGSLSVGPGDAWSLGDSFAAAITGGDEYAVRASEAYVEGSKVQCSGAYARP